MAAISLKHFPSSSLRSSPSSSDQIPVKNCSATMVTFCAKKNRTPKQKMEDISALISGSLSDKKTRKMFESLAKDMLAMNAELMLPQSQINVEEVHSSLTDQLRRQLLEGAVNVLKKQLEQARREYRERRKRLKTDGNKKTECP